MPVNKTKVRRNRSNKKIGVIVITDSHLEMLAKLRAAGLTNIKQQKNIGTITGEVDPAAYDQLASIPGVVVERAKSYQLPPPDSQEPC